MQRDGGFTVERRNSEAYHVKLQSSSESNAPRNRGDWAQNENSARTPSNIDQDSELRRAHGPCWALVAVSDDDGAYFHVAKKTVKVNLNTCLLLFLQSPQPPRSLSLSTMSFLGLRKWGTPVMKPMWPFIAASGLTFFLVGKMQDMGVRSEAYKNDPRNPYAAKVAKEAHH
ncbi:hypothetical protein JAAARDRAFT_577708 [Jaapia argillacea MUCL 33604]|uniref:ATP synthase subunit J, mitochondrial n=1 Tax=Jaapia argillacea MUCL 33604 TaxID=933084 RepID=A0A067Q561_9AGAM|nr:hypothetical protein JAAARDRAFT_577708 [Jaapia argillacea MUCL 33604]